MTKELLSGNEAIALAAARSNAKMGTGYPGTPSTEILETLAGFGRRDIVTRWAPNEKVALEVGIGAAFAGARVLVTMKHVGVNVAADPLFTAAYTGVRGGLVLVTADDPGMHSSQNEQDNRNYAAFSCLPMLEPSSSQEAYDFTRRAFGLSERFETIVILRVTTRICHSKSLVTPHEAKRLDRPYRFERDIARYVMVPGNARKRHVVLEERIAKMAGYAETTDLNHIVNRPVLPKAGVLASGVAYEYVREVAPNMPVFKIGMSWPLPLRRIEAFQKTCGDLVVVEELSDFMLNAVRAAGIPARGKHASFRQGELNPDRVERILAGEPDAPPPVRLDLPPPRPPVLCPGCGHRSVFAVLKKLGLIATGDIGCYTLGALPPLTNLDTCICMGASIGNALGLERVVEATDSKQIVAVIGDSTFFHSGLTGVLDAVYNGSHGVLLILDNRTTAMTGGQDHPGTGRRLDGRPAREIDPAEVCRAMGVADVKVLDSYDRKGFEEALKDSLAKDDYSVIVCRRPCLLLDRKAKRDKYRIDAELCKNCGACLKMGCPALKQMEERVEIDPILCAGCGLCFDICKFNAISKVETDD